MRSHVAFYLIKVNILWASVDFYAINIFVTCERSFRYLLLLCHKTLETIVFDPQFYEPLKSLKLSWKSIKLFWDNWCFVFFVERSIWECIPNVYDFWQVTSFALNVSSLWNKQFAVWTANLLGSNSREGFPVTKGWYIYVLNLHV